MKNAIFDQSCSLCNNISYEFFQFTIESNLMRRLFIGLETQSNYNLRAHAISYIVNVYGKKILLKCLKIYLYTALKIVLLNN